MPKPLCKDRTLLNDYKRNNHACKHTDTPPGLLVELLELVELSGHHKTLGAQVVEDVAEKFAVPVDEVVLLQRVQHDWDAPIKHPGQFGLRKPAQKNLK